MNSRFQDHYKKTGVLGANARKYKRAKEKLENRRAIRTEHFSRQRNLTGLCDESESQSK
jgi:hypothetical protein